MSLRIYGEKEKGDTLGIKTETNLRNICYVYGIDYTKLIR